GWSCYDMFTTCICGLFCFFFFFFQAEDGIRDLIVTGVQTCALPIFAEAFVAAAIAAPASIAAATKASASSLSLGRIVTVTGLAQIGRASCRERGGGSVGVGVVEERRGRRGGGTVAGSMTRSCGNQ